MEYLWNDFHASSILLPSMIYEDVGKKKSDEKRWVLRNICAKGKFSTSFSHTNVTKRSQFFILKTYLIYELVWSVSFPRFFEFSKRKSNAVNDPFKFDKLILHNIDHFFRCNSQEKKVNKKVPLELNILSCKIH